jgi:hypothetical protein
MRSTVVLVLLLGPVSALGAELKPIVLDPSYEHDKFVTRPLRP